MAKAVFIASSHSRYKDRPGEWYHFPKRQYLSRVAQTVGDWVIFYEGRAGGNRGYYAVQKVKKIIDDPVDISHSYAILDRVSGLSFEQFVPRLRNDDSPYETGLPASGGVNASAVRIISDADFSDIIEEGLREQKSPETLPRSEAFSRKDGFAETQVPFEILEQTTTVRERYLTSRAFRDASFARQVKKAYRARCAMSGLELRNGGGRPEVEAAHIIPVAKNGPDTVRNGLALSGTVHWMFDRGLLSVGDDNSILIARDSVADATADRLLTDDHKLILPTDMAFRPSPEYLDWHRRNVYKG